MNRRSILAWIAPLLFVCSAAAQTRVLYSFENASEIDQAIRNHIRINPTPEHATNGKRALRVEFQPTTRWPNIRFDARQPWDWHAFQGLAIDIANPTTRAITFHIRIDDDPRSDGATHARDGSATVAPGEAATFVFPFTPDPMSLGMRGLPPLFPQFTRLSTRGDSSFNYAHITAFQVYLIQPETPQALILDNIRLVTSARGGMKGIVDAFGQYTGADWPGKLGRIDEFKSRLAGENAAITAAPTLPDRDSYGGWSKGPTLKATGFFRTQKLDGKWWLITPDGHLFFSMGIDCIGLGGDTIIDERREMFTWLPEPGDPLAKQFGYVRGVHMGPVKEGRTFNFYTANLERKYGADYQSAAIAMALKRLPAWGFNTIGNWSDSRAAGAGRMPYTATLGIGGNHARVASGSDYWGKMHDPYDPQFARDVAGSIARGVAGAKGDRWCMGYFVDNELSWGGFGNDGGRYGLAYGALSAPAGQPAKSAFVAQLKSTYATIEALDAAWNIQLKSWDELAGPFSAPLNLTDVAKRDMGAFVKDFARRYFRTINDALKKADPDHLYLGCRFAWHTPESVAAAAEICDVVSFNIYAPTIDARRAAEMTALDKPCLIGEFHFGSLDRGMFHPGLVSTPSQAARAQMYKDYLASVIDCPALVGCHWFQYVDEPLTGRSYDGENYNIGFVSVTDTPYPEMVGAAKQIHAEAYPRRFGGK